MVKFKVGDRVEILARGSSVNAVGDIGVIKEVTDDSMSVRVKVKGKPSTGNWSNIKDIKLLELKPTKNQRITALEETVTKQGEEINELKMIVAQIRKPSTVVEEALANDTIEFEGKQYKKVDREAREGDVVIYPKLHSGWHGDITENKPYRVHVSLNKVRFNDDNGDENTVYGLSEGYDDIASVLVYELFEVKPQSEGERLVKQCEQHFSSVEKSPNKKRAEMIEKAKWFIAKNEDEDGHYKVNTGLGQWTYGDFIVNQEKRTVVVLLRGINSGKIRARGIAKCMPGDVFNEHIGRAIALGRALGLDVSEFEQAVQPTGLVAGHIIEVKYRDGSNVVTREIVTHDYEVDGTSNTANFIEEEAHWHKIINDTNAQYTIPTGPAPVEEGF